MAHSSTNSIAPSKSTVYVSNLPFSLTNNDLHKLFCHHGKIARVTIVKHPETRQSKGVAFVLYTDRQSAQDCVREHDSTQIGGRMVRCGMAKDNGRSAEFIKKREYHDKSRCFECGECGHLSYRCRKNLLGDRDPPPKKKKKRKMTGNQDESNKNEDEDEGDDNDDKGGDDNDDETLGAAIAFQRMKADQEGGGYLTDQPPDHAKPKRHYVKDDYFSDEEHLD